MHGMQWHPNEPTGPSTAARGAMSEGVNNERRGGQEVSSGRRE